MKIIITGTSGMVGEGVLHEAVNHPKVTDVLVIGRKNSGLKHPKITELLIQDFFQATDALSSVKGYDACFFCLGVSSVGIDKDLYEKLTYTLTLDFAKAILPNNPNLTFCYISGSGTDSSEKGRLHWARVKGKTENELLALGFKDAYAVRPGYLQPTPGLKNTHPYYAYVKWMYPVFKVLMPAFFSTLAELGQAMLALTIKGYEKKHIEVKDILLLAKQSA